MRQSMNFLICMPIRITIRNCCMLVPLAQANASGSKVSSTVYPTPPRHTPLHLPVMGSYAMVLRRSKEGEDDGG